MWRRWFVCMQARARSTGCRRARGRAPAGREEVVEEDAGLDQVHGPAPVHPVEGRPGLRRRRAQDGAQRHVEQIHVAAHAARGRHRRRHVGVESADSLVGVTGPGRRLQARVGAGPHHAGGLVRGPERAEAGEEVASHGGGVVLAAEAGLEGVAAPRPDDQVRRVEAAELPGDAPVVLVEGDAQRATAGIRLRADPCAAALPMEAAGPESADDLLRFPWRFSHGSTLKELSASKYNHIYARRSLTFSSYCPCCSHSGG
jgi:hypothetical protein